MSFYYNGNGTGGEWGMENGDWRLGDWGVKVLKFDGAIAPRVLKFDSGSAAEGCGGRLTFIEGALL